MELSSTAIIPSGNPERVDGCLQRLVRQTVPFDRIIIAVWGTSIKEREEVSRRAHSVLRSAEVVESGTDVRPETNLNNAIKYLSNRPTNRVAFLNDDTLLDDHWHESMQQAAQKDGDHVVHASVVFFKFFPNFIQSAGHILYNSKPRDHKYRKMISGLADASQPLCPCGNSAFVPWNALQEIQRGHPEVWDPNFIRWQSCFDFGLKLRLRGYDCRLVSSARAVHEGYLDKSLRGQKLKDEDVKIQLRSRIFLYGKFFPEKERKEAMKILESSLDRWARGGYPHAGRKVKGDVIRSMYACAKIEAKNLLEKTSTEWLQLLSCLNVQLRRKWLFGE